jgi:hypothetical protein
MSTVNSKLLEFFICIPKLETDGSNWVIFKDHFSFAAGAAALGKHIDGMGGVPPLLIFTVGGPTPLMADQITEFEKYDTELSKWMMVMGEAIIKQAITTMIPNSLFLRFEGKQQPA